MKVDMNVRLKVSDEYVRALAHGTGTLHLVDLLCQEIKNDQLMCKCKAEVEVLDADVKVLDDDDDDDTSEGAKRYREILMDVMCDHVSDDEVSDAMNQMDDEGWYLDEDTDDWVRK